MSFSYINFLPYVGEQYASIGLNGKKILVLGESHYCNEGLQCDKGKCLPICKRENMNYHCHEKTNIVVNSFIQNYDGSGEYQSFLCFERAIAGKVLSQEEREDLWRKLMFYNFIQFAQPGPRCSIHQEYWEHSGKAFKELLETFQPDYIIVWGCRLYKGLPDMDGSHSSLTIDGDSTDIWTYTINGKNIPAMKVYHPSTPRGKNWNYWHKFYKAFLELD